MKNLIIAVFIILLSCGLGYGATSYTAATCSQANVQTAVTSCTNDAQCTQVNIPTGSCSWGSGITINKAMTIKGAGEASTVLTRTGTRLFILNAPGRITDIGFVLASGATSAHPMIFVSGKGWRIDHCTFTNTVVNTSYGIIAESTTAADSPAGLIDNCTLTNSRIFANGTGNSFAENNKEWLEDAGFGTSDFVYIEDCTLSKTFMGNVVDAERGGKYVFRFNTVTNGDIQAHVQSMTFQRSTRAWEIYNNTSIGTLVSFYRRPFFIRAGEGFIFNNTISGTWSVNTVVLDSRRAYDTQVPKCDGTYASDGNEVGENGWLCRDQIGAGKDSTLTTYTGTYPNYIVTWATQTKSPAYIWGNTTAVSLNLQSYLHLEANRDYYDGGTWGLQTSSSSPFNGTTGVGRGTYANRPSTCTTGVGYWATDRGTWNKSGSGGQGQLFKCTSTNTWTLSYEPYEYPHPLRSGELPPPIDTQAPVITNATPSGLSCDAESPVNISLAVNTNELAYCRYSTSDVDYLLMTAFSSTGGYSHSSTISLACDASYTYYVRCRDQSANQNTNTTSTSVAFTINAAEAETEAPVITNATPSGAISCSSNPMTVTLALIATDEGAITCKYDADNVAYASMGGDNGGDMASDNASQSQFIDDSYEISTSIAYRQIGASYYTESGVSFVSGGGELDTAQFYLAKYGSPTGNATVKIYAHSGTYGTSSVATGEALATSDNFNVATLGTDAGWRTFTFSEANRITLVDTTNYVAVVAYSGGDANNYVRIYRDNTTLTHDGNEVYLDGESWAYAVSRDPLFRINVMRAGTGGSSGRFYKDLSLACGSNYTYYVACSDGTTASDNTTITFSIPSGSACSVAGCIEFEDCTNASPMLEYADATASGGAYVTTTQQFAGTSTCSVTTAAGTYRLVIVTRAADTGSDSVYLQIDSQDMVQLGLNTSFAEANWNTWITQTMKYFSSSNSWEEYQFTLTADTHSFVFSGREIDAKLDYFYLIPRDDPPPAPLPPTRFMIGAGQTMVISPTTGGCQVIIE